MVSHSQISTEYRAECRVLSAPIRARQRAKERGTMCLRRDGINNTLHWPCRFTCVSRLVLANSGASFDSG